MNKPRIAVLTPVYNEADTLPIMLRGLLRQTIKPSKVLIGDNESVDGSPEVARSVLEGRVRYRVVRVRRDPRIGKWNINNVYWLLSRVLDAEEGEPYDYVATIEADVLLEPRYFEKLIKYFERDPKLCVTGGRLEPLGLMKDPFPLRRVSVMLWGSNRLYRAECWNQINREVDLRKLPAWDTDHVLIALLKGWHVYQAPSAKSVAMRFTRLFKGAAKGVMDALHGLPLWWAIYKAVEYADPGYLTGYVASRLTKSGGLRELQELYYRAALSVAAEKVRGTYKY